MEGIWEHSLENPIEFYNQLSQLIIDKFKLFTFLLEIRSNARTNQDQYDRIAYQKSYKIYIDFQSKKQKIIRMFTNSFDNIIQIYTNDHESIKNFYD